MRGKERSRTSLIEDDWIVLVGSFEKGEKNAQFRYCVISTT
jgi:hypothetical protein